MPLLRRSTRASDTATSTYTFPGLVASASYTVRLHFAELFQTAAGKRLFNVASTARPSCRTSTSSRRRAPSSRRPCASSPPPRSASGQIVINFTTVDGQRDDRRHRDHPGHARTTPDRSRQQPRPARTRSRRTTATLSVLGADDGGEAEPELHLGHDGYSARGGRLQRQRHQRGQEQRRRPSPRRVVYSLQVTVKDQGGLTVTSAVTVTVNQTLTSIVVSPASATVAPSATQQFTAIGA